MGPVFGKTTIVEPQYQVLKSSDKFEIRLYSSYVVAEIDCGENHEEDVAELARYIGVSGLPKHKPDTRITDPRSQVVATPPSLSEKSDVQFILPARFTSVEQVPVPQNKRILIKQIPQRAVAVIKFTGFATEARCLKKLRRLYDMLLEESLHTATEYVELEAPQVEADVQKGPPLFNPDTVPWSVAEYHPYLTLPVMRRNEVWLDLRSDNPALLQLIAQYQAAHPEEVTEEKTCGGGGGGGARAKGGAEGGAEGGAVEHELEYREVQPPPVGKLHQTIQQQQREADAEEPPSF